mmetsp:Transcript_316/g.427  ORF Transcript_316/g.427 Transcript_316/m.427 type:complete len:97 (+) Transcript_316:984-1274(+)
MRLVALLKVFEDESDAPTNLLLCNNNSVNDGSEMISEGSDPTNVLFERLTLSKLTSFWNDRGIEPSKRLFSAPKLDKDAQSPNASGIVPPIIFPPK